MQSVSFFTRRIHRINNNLRKNMNSMEKKRKRINDTKLPSRFTFIRTDLFYMQLDISHWKNYTQTTDCFFSVYFFFLHSQRNASFYFHNWYYLFLLVFFFQSLSSYPSLFHQRILFHQG